MVQFNGSEISRRTWKKTWKQHQQSDQNVQKLKAPNDQYFAYSLNNDNGNTTSHSFNGLFSRTTRVSRHQKSRTILV